MIASLSTQYVHTPARLDLAALNIDVLPEPVAVEPKPWDQHSGELCQLVTDYDPKFLPSGGAIVERKHDGWRAIWLRGELVSRSGATLWSTAHLWPALRALEARFGEPMTFHGEYVVDGSFAATSAECNGAKNASATVAPVEGHGVLHLFDAVPMSVWEGRERGAALVERKHWLKRALGTWPEGGLAFVPHIGLHDTGMKIEALARAQWQAGHEGIVIKDSRSFYESGRSRAWMRLKRSLTLDLRVIGYGERKGDNAGTLAHIIVDNDGKACKVASGFDERERAVLLHHPERMIGRIAEIGAMEILDSGALRQAKFLRWRDDKA
mgnify:CR=1 FL=1